MGLESVFNGIAGIVQVSFGPVGSLLLQLGNGLAWLKDYLTSLPAQIRSSQQIFDAFLGLIRFGLYILSYTLYIPITAIQIVSNIIGFVLSNPNVITYLTIVSGLGFGGIYLAGYFMISSIFMTLIQSTIAALVVVPIVSTLFNIYIIGLNPDEAINLTKHNLLSPNIETFINNTDIILYLAAVGLTFAFFANFSVFSGIPLFILGEIVVILLSIVLFPIIVIAYFYYDGNRPLPLAVRRFRSNFSDIFFANLDLLVYLYLSTGFLCLINDTKTTIWVQLLLPRYLYLDSVIFGLLLIFGAPIGFISYYMVTQQITPVSKIVQNTVSGIPVVIYYGSVGLFDAISLFRADCAAIYTRLYDIWSATTAKVDRLAQDPNPGLTDSERMFFAQLFGDNPKGQPSIVYYPGSQANYDGSYTKVLPMKDKAYIGKYPTPDAPNDKSAYYGKWKFKDCNLMFYGDPNHELSLYVDWADKELTIAEYIALPYKILSGRDTVDIGNGITVAKSVVDKLEALAFKLLNVVGKYNSMEAVPDYVLQAFATGITETGSPYENYICYANFRSLVQGIETGGPGKAWPSEQCYKILWPTVADVKAPKNPNSTDPQDIAAANQAFIYYSFTELINNLNDITSGYMESVERFGTYLHFWGADTVTNPNFVKTPTELQSYVYTFADCEKNAVMFNNFLSYAFLPENSQGALASQTLAITNAYTSQIYEAAELSTDPNSSANLFLNTDLILELLSTGVKLQNFLGLYQNIRAVNASFLFNRSVNPNNPLSVLTTMKNTITTDASYSYSPQVLAAIQDSQDSLNSGSIIGQNIVIANAELHTLLNIFAKNITQQKIAQALEDAPSQKAGLIYVGTPPTPIPNDYGSPYVRRLFYEAAGVLSSIYSDLFSIMNDVVFIDNSNYIPDPNDPIDMWWFRYTVQNWNNPFQGIGTYKPQTDGLNGTNSYLCRGYQDRTLHTSAAAQVMSRIDRILFSDQNGTIGIYDRIFSLLDYVVAYNNLIDQIFTLGLLGSDAQQCLNNLIFQMSNKYLRLNQNNRMMDLTSLLPGNIYQHFHVNINLAISKYGANQSLGTSTKKISNIADLRAWVNQSLSLDTGYESFKKEVAAGFIYKSVLDLLWWPQFCAEYYYVNPTGNAPTTIPRFSYGAAGTAGTPGNANIVANLANGYIAQGMYDVFQGLAATRSGASTMLKPAAAKNWETLRTHNPKMWDSFCYAHRHDALIPYVYFTGTIKYPSSSISYPADYDKIVVANAFNDPSSANYNDYSNSPTTNVSAIMSNNITSERWLKSYSSVGSDTSLPPQFSGGQGISRALVRQQFFADPFSWFDTNKSYQIYPLQYGDITDGYTTTWLSQDQKPLRSYWSGKNSYYQLDQTSINKLQATTAYAPLIDTSMVTTLTPTVVSSMASFSVRSTGLQTQFTGLTVSEQNLVLAFLLYTNNTSSDDNNRFYYSYNGTVYNGSAINVIQSGSLQYGIQITIASSPNQVIYLGYYELISLLINPGYVLSVPQRVLTISGKARTITDNPSLGFRIELNSATGGFAITSLTSATTGSAIQSTIGAKGTTTPTVISALTGPTIPADYIFSISSEFVPFSSLDYQAQQLITSTETILQVSGGGLSASGLTITVQSGTQQTIPLFDNATLLTPVNFAQRGSTTQEKIGYLLSGTFGQIYLTMRELVYLYDNSNKGTVADVYIPARNSSLVTNHSSFFKFAWQAGPKKYTITSGQTLTDATQYSPIPIANSVNFLSLPEAEWNTYRFYVAFETIGSGNQQIINSFLLSPLYYTFTYNNRPVGIKISHFTISDPRTNNNIRYGIKMDLSNDEINQPIYLTYMEIANWYSGVTDSDSESDPVNLKLTVPARTVTNIQSPVPGIKLENSVDGENNNLYTLSFNIAKTTKIDIVGTRAQSVSVGINLQTPISDSDLQTWYKYNPDLETGTPIVSATTSGAFNIKFCKQ